jgi:glycosyltransferase involved in cell wall biosynthesis
VLVSRLTLVRTFDYAWGAGPPQAKYLHRLGFPRSRIKIGFACADTKSFSKLAHFETRPWPHIFLYVGRYVTVKNMRRMECAFLRAISDMPESDWILRCIGGGDVMEDLWSERTIHPRIEHLGFKSPVELQEAAKGAGCFILPSMDDHWGVVVHEFAAAGLPMICSKQVQATSQYLKDGYNGYLFDAFDENEIYEKMSVIMRMPDADLVEMGKRSQRLGMSYTTEDWANRVLSFGEG